MSTIFHDGESAVQTRAGESEIAERNGKAIQPRIPAGAFGFLAERSWIVVSSTDAAGAMWTDLIAGGVGTMAASDDGSTLTIAGTLAGGRLSLNPGTPIGLLAIDLATRRRLRINGHVRTTSTSSWTIQVDEAMPNCPKYIQRRTESAQPPLFFEPTLPPWESIIDTVLAHCDTMFVGTMHAVRGCDASHRGGPPGFVRRQGRELIWPDYPGNSVFQTLGNLHCDPRCSLLLIDPASGHGLILSGQATVAWDQADPDGRSGGTARFVSFTIVDGRTIRLPISWSEPEPSPWLP